MPQCRTGALNQAIITLVWYISLELHKGGLQLVLLAEAPKYGTINLHLVHAMGKSFGLREWFHRKVCYLVQNDGYLA